MHSPIHHPQSLIMYLQSSVCPISDHPKWEYLSGHLQEVVVCNNGSGGSMGGGGGGAGRASPYFVAKLRPEGPKNRLLENATPPPPLYLRAWMTGRPPVPCLKVWLRH